MKKFFITVFVMVLFIPSIAWYGLKIADADLFNRLDFDIGEKREKTEITDLSDLALSGEKVVDYFADRAPFRSAVISFKRTVNTVVESPYEDEIKPAAMKALYNVTDKREEMAVLAVTKSGTQKAYSSQKVINLLDKKAEQKRKEEEEEKKKEEEALEKSYEIIEEVEPDCENPGYVVKLNTKTNETIREEIPALGHDWQVEEIVDATYISGGYTNYFCTRCDATKKGDETEKLVDASYMAPVVVFTTLMGRYDWLFLYGPEEAPYDLGTNVLSDADMALYAQKLSTLQAMCDARGIMFAMIIAPNKSTVYPEYMPTLDVVNTYKRVPRLYDYIKANTGVRISFPVNEMLSVRSNYDPYYKYDSHWNYVGAYVGTQALYGLIGMPQKSVSSLKMNKTKYDARGDLIELANLDASSFAPFYEYYPYYKTKVTMLAETEGITHLTNIYRTESDSGNDQRFVMIGDSYRNYMIDFIKKDFNHCTFAHREHKNEIVGDVLAANVLVIQTVERNDYKAMQDVDWLIQVLSTN